MLAVCFIPQIRVHDVFYPHPHMRDLKAAAKRGKILVITLVISAGLTILVSAAILRGSKEEEKTDDMEKIDPAELRGRVIAAAVAGRHGLSRGRKQALEMAFFAYARMCGIERKSIVSESSPHVTCKIGNDRVTVVISNDVPAVEVQAICGNIGAKAIVELEDGSVRSSIFTPHAMEREAKI